MPGSEIKLITLDSIGYTYLLQIDTSKILINASRESLSKNIGQVDCCLLSHPSIEFIGGIGSIQTKKIICTLPVLIISQAELSEVNKRTGWYDDQLLEDTFNSVEHKKHFQPVFVNSIRIVGYNAGVTLGGTIWHINYGIHDILFMLKVNHRKENHIDGLSVEIKQPFLSVMDSGYTFSKIVNKKNRDSDLLNIIDDVFNDHYQADKDPLLQAHSDNKKLIIFIPYSRLIELGFILSERKNLKVALVGTNAKSFLENIKTLLEWTGKNAHDKFSANKLNPLIFSITPMEFFETLPDSDVYIVPDPCSVYAKSLLYKLNGRCIIINCFEDDIHASDESEYFNALKNNTEIEMDVPVITTREEIVHRKQEIKKKEIKINKDIDKNTPWYEIGNTYFFDKYKPDLYKIAFPLKKYVQGDTYGEFYVLPEVEEPEMEEKPAVIEKRRVEKNSVCEKKNKI